MSVRRWIGGAVFAATWVMLASGAGAQSPSAPAPAPGAPTATAIFAGGCFWCMEPPFEKLDGVTAVTSGYTGGSVPEPSYEAVSAGRTGHYEAVEVTYDPEKVGYDTLLDVFWKNIDPLDGGGQFCDRGDQYRAAIFYENAEQRQAAEASKAAIERAGVPRGKIVTPVLPAAPFYPAEDYHQDYYKKNPLRYQFYRTGCGRDRRLATVWGAAASAKP
jgi:peptide-methionine (S)-S-oxide reductase